MTCRPLPGPIAYLTGEYPKASHTFILREIAALRRLGATVLTASIRRTGSEHHIGPEEAEAARTTFHVLEAVLSPAQLLSAHGSLFLRAPRRWVAALVLALRSGRPGAAGLARQIAYFAEAGVLAAWLRRSGATHLHNHFADSSCSVAMIAAALAELPFSYTLHGPAELFEPQSWRLDLKTARARFVACISHFARSQAMLFSDPADWRKLAIIRCGVTPAAYDAPPASCAAGLRLLFVGRLTAIKGLLVLFDVLDRLRAEHPDITLDLIGDGPDRAMLERRAAAHGEAVRFLGYRSQAAVAEALAQADALVLPSFAEGVPVVLMEAMASRRPVVATRVAGVPELVEDGVSGWLTPPGDASALADRIAALRADPALRRRMGESGRAAVAAGFDVDVQAARLLRLFVGEP